ncbi:hypothetical protein GGX14DRAFT_577531 [Mycena pura]|uniref:Uncharacterized protein n=1 Tax=Mycena pura TaxID=153505 RepID=A0AAD6UUY0_9AGAR|nr:hypothetical protein GGX14DRAFT_577531 [Mycena pura]
MRTGADADAHHLPPGSLRLDANPPRLQQAVFAPWPGSHRCGSVRTDAANPTALVHQPVDRLCTFPSKPRRPLTPPHCGPNAGAVLDRRERTCDPHAVLFPAASQRRLDANTALRASIREIGNHGLVALQALRYYIHAARSGANLSHTTVCCMRRTANHAARPPRLQVAPAPLTRVLTERRSTIASNATAVLLSFPRFHDASTIPHVPPSLCLCKTLRQRLKRAPRILRCCLSRAFDVVATRGTHALHSYTFSPMSCNRRSPLTASARDICRNLVQQQTSSSSSAACILACVRVRRVTHSGLALNHHISASTNDVRHDRVLQQCHALRWACRTTSATTHAPARGCGAAAGCGRLRFRAPRARAALHASARVWTGCEAWARGCTSASDVRCDRDRIQKQRHTVRRHVTRAPGASHNVRRYLCTCVRVRRCCWTQLFALAPAHTSCTCPSFTLGCKRNDRVQQRLPHLPDAPGASLGRVHEVRAGASSNARVQWQLRPRAHPPQSMSPAAHARMPRTPSHTDFPT